jgi:hypothetical protein
LAFAQTHDGAFAVLLFNLGEGETERSLPFVADILHCALCHAGSPEHV